MNVSARKNVKATFKAQPKLTVSVINHGTVVSSPAGLSCTRAIGVTAVIGPCKTPFPKGTVVTLTATPAAGKTFVSWGGACLGVLGNVCTVTLSAAKSASARFSG